MHRLFETTTLRRQIYLDGRWNFALDPDDRGEEERWFEAFPTDADEQWVPSVWNTTPCYSGYEGPAWYHRTFQVNNCTALVINIGAAAHSAKVWLDGEILGEHFSGFLPFGFVVKRPTPGTHTLIVRVDNTLSDSTIPGPHLDWYRYGGLTRSVWAEELPGKACIRHFNLLPRLEDGRGVVTVRARILSLTDEPLEDTMRLEINGERSYAEALTLAPGEEREIAFDVAVPNPRVWQPNDPQLYLARLSFAGDDLIERFGLRSIEVSGSRILLNGRPVKLLGINRHEDHPDWGFAIPGHITARDLRIVQDLGFNAMRGAHYPNDPRLLDMCDERGILFMQEIPLWQFTEEQMRRPIIRERARRMLLEMIERDMNHPCIWAWSVLNECATETEGGREMVEMLVEAAKEADPTRLVTFASNRRLADICFDLVDVVCVNAYYGWYREEEWTRGLEPSSAWEALLRRLREKIGEKPLVISEFGAGAVPGCRGLEGFRWSEDYQRRLLTELVEFFLSRDDVAGFHIWTLFDFRVDCTDVDRALRRPRGFNNKGLLDEHRRPKLAYWAIRELLRHKRENYACG